MVNKLLKTFLLVKKNWIIFLLAVIYLAATLPALLDNNHFLYNLEPYPDGMLYALSGRNIVLGREFGLVSADGFIRHWVPPMYSLVLGVGYFFFGTAISSFYLTNVVLHLVGLVFLYLILRKTTSHWWAQLLGLAVYLTHIILIWLPTLPMGENLIVPLSLILIFALLEKRAWLKYGLMIFSLGSLFLTRYSTIGTVLAGLLILFIQLYPKLNRKLRLLLFLSLPLAVLAFDQLLKFRGIRTMRVIGAIIADNNPYFSLRFVLPNLMAYIRMLLLGEGWYLWLPIGISSAVVTGLFGYAIYYLYRTKKFIQANILLLFLLAQLPMQLVFYVADARYLILTIPLIALGVGWLVDKIGQQKKWLIGLVIFGLALQLFNQRAFIKEIIGNNLLGRSTAWQYEAILHFNNVLTDNDLLITALPPFLIDAYQTRSYRPLPLSASQEFMQKKQFVWGEDINYENLGATYQTWLEEGKTLYISNAYITHQQAVIADYEQYKQTFKLELVSVGCEQACNIYRLSALE